MGEGIGSCDKCGQNVSSRFKHECAPSEVEMRVQMFNTMGALSRMANAITDHLTADKKPCETATSDHSYADLQVTCKECDGVAVFEDYGRHYLSPEDTCKCPHATLEGFNVGAEITAIYSDVHAERQTRQTPGPRGEQGPTGEPGPPADLTKIHEVLDKHQKAFAIIGSLGVFEKVGFSQTDPGRVVRSLARLSTCLECIGTGWIARDESCKKCNRQGYIKV